MSVSDDRADETEDRERSARPTGASGDAGKDRPTRSRGGTDTKVSLPARLVRFLREVVAELRKVIWPTRKQLVTYTAVVLVFVSVMVAFVALLDLGFGKAVFYVFG